MDIIIIFLLGFASGIVFQKYYGITNLKAQLMSKIDEQIKRFKK
mgnify:CR=1 FL=1